MEAREARADPARAALAGIDLTEWERWEEAERLPTGEWRLIVRLGDQRKATARLWAKKVRAVDTTKANGYAFEGEWAGRVPGSSPKSMKREIILAPGEVAVAVVESGSWRHKGQVFVVFVATEDGVYSSSFPWRTRGDRIKAIHAVDEILRALKPKSVEEAVAEQIRAIEARYGVKIEWRIVEGGGHAD